MYSHNLLTRLVTSVLILSYVLSLGLSTRVLAAGTVVVDPNNSDWGFFTEGGAGSGQYVEGPDTPPAGSGSAQLNATNTSDGVIIGTALHAGTRLDELTTLTYHTYRTSGGAELAPALQLNIDYDLTDGTTSWQGRLVYEPYQTGTNPTTGVWESWDALDSGARWWASGAPGNTVCPHSTPCDMATVLTNFPNAGIHATLGAVIFKAGSGWTGYQGSVDNLTIGINGDDTTYDFEPILTVHNITQNTHHTSIQNGVNKATAGDVLEIDPGTYVENVVVDKSVTLRGAGAGTDPAQHTILDGTTLGGASGIHLNSNVTDVTIEDLRVQNYTMSGETAGIYAAVGNDNFVAQNLHVYNNTGGRAGLHMNGPVDTVLIDNVEAHNNTSRGIVIWNGFKTNITITNNDVQGNNCCGIELQDGTASGVTMSNNTVIGNGDSGMAAIGLTSGAGPNVIANNTVQNNGRFGIEIKLPNGTGATSGDGSIVVENNHVSFTTSAGMNNRDHAGIAVFRRSFLTTEGYADIPNGVVVRNNTVEGYVQSNPGSDSTGFGIVVEGTNMFVTGNTLNNNDVGLQIQAGHLPYTANTSTDGDQSNLADDYFGRGNSPVGCASTSGNTFSGNGVDERNVGASAGNSSVTNTDTGEIFCSIQSAIDDTDTVDGHTLEIDPGTYAENVVVDKVLTLNGAGNGTNPAVDTIITPSSPGVTITTGGTSAANRVVISNMTVTGATGGGNTGSGYLIQEGDATIEHVSFLNVTAVNNTGNGIAISHTGTVGDIIVNGCNLSDNAGTGFRIPTSVSSFDGLTMSNCTINDNGVNGLSTGASGSPNVTNIHVSDTTFEGNGGLLLGSGDVSMFQFNGDASFTNVDITGDGAHVGFQLRGNAGVNPAGTVVFDNLTIGGEYQHPTTWVGAGLIISYFSDVSGISFNDVVLDVAPVSGKLAMNLYTDSVTGDLDLGNTTFGGNATADILHLSTGDADATGATFTGAADNFAIEDRVVHVIDTGTPFGLVTWVANNVFVTTNSFAAPTTTTANIQRGIDAVATGGTVNVGSGSFDSPAQVTITRDVTVMGVSEAATTLGLSFNTGSSGDARGWFLVNTGVEFHLSDVTLDGSGQLVWQAIRHKGSGTLDQVTFTEIKFNESGPDYAGTAVAAFGDGPVDISNSTFSEIGRVGVLYFGTGVSGSVFDNNSYTGKGSGDFLDYMLDINAGAVVEVTNNQATGNQGVASVDGSTSAAILVSTFSGAGTEATITGNTLTGNSTGIFVGFDGSDTSVVVANRNAISGNDDGAQTSGSSSSNDMTCNWWGAASGPSGQGAGSGDSVDTNITFAPWLTSADLNGPCIAVPDLSLEKSGDLFAQLGDTVAYTLAYANLTTVTATGVEIAETVPMGTVFNAGASTAGWSCTPDNNGGSSCTLAIGSVAGLSNGSATFAVDIVGPFNLGDTFENTASIGDDGANGADNDTNNNSSAAQTTIFDMLYLTTEDDGSIDGLSFKDEDIIVFSEESGSWAMFFDGSDVGITDDIYGFTILTDGSILMVFKNPITVPGVGGVTRNDVVQFFPVTVGNNTTGTFALVFDGSDVGLASDGENLDSVSVTADGRLVFSTTGSWSVPGATGTISGADEDLFVFNATSLGMLTAGSFEILYDGSDVDMSSEDVNGAALDGVSGDLYLTTTDNFSVTGLSGRPEDIFRFVPTSLGSNTAGSYGPIFFDGSAVGFTRRINGFAIGDNQPLLAITPPPPTDEADLSIVMADDTDPAVVGDTVNYTVTVDNSGPDAAQHVQVQIVLDSHLLLQSYSSSAGSCSDSFNFGTNQTELHCSLGTLAADDDVTIQIETQATASGTANNTASVSSDTTDLASGNDSDTETTTINSGGGETGNVLYVSATGSGSVGGVSYQDEDILAYYADSNSWSLFFDGSLYGITRDLNAFHITTNGSIYMSFDETVTIPNVGTVDDSDIVFLNSTTGLFSMAFDGSAHDLTTSDEDIDGLFIDENGNFIVSTTGTAKVNGTSLEVRDEDVMRFNVGTQTWEMWIDNSDTGYTGDVDALWMDGSDAYFSLDGSFSAVGAERQDVFIMHVTAFGGNTSGSYGPGLFFDASAHGFSGDVDGLHVVMNP